MFETKSALFFKSYFEVLTLVLQNVTLFGIWIIQDIIKDEIIRMGPNPSWLVKT